MKGLRKAKSKYFKYLNVKSITDSKTFWKAINPNFSDKGSSSGKTTLVENTKVLSDKKEIFQKP